MSVDVRLEGKHDHQCNTRAKTDTQAECIAYRVIKTPHAVAA